MNQYTDIPLCEFLDDFGWDPERGAIDPDDAAAFRR